LDEARAEYTKWDDYNGAMLDTTFHSQEFSAEYRAPVRSFFFLAPTFETLVSNYLDDVRTKVTRLESVRGRLEFCAEPSASPSEESESRGRPVQYLTTEKESAALTPYLDELRKDHPDPMRCAFLMMKYEDTPLHDRIVEAVGRTCASFGIKAVRADTKRYADDLLPNVRTYLEGCGLGIAIFERLTSEDFNPDVSLEVGYMMALGKPVCLLKDSTLASLQTDLVGRLYEHFDTQRPEQSIPPKLEKWLRDKGIV
jgi:hypothetical protein